MSDALVQHCARIKHDLGKYVAFQVRWVAADAPLAERCAALEADLKATRRGPDGTVDAPTLWRELRAPLVGDVALADGTTVDLSAEPLVATIDAAMATITAVISALDAGTVGDVDVDRGTDAAKTVAEACRELHRSAMRGLG